MLASTITETVRGRGELDDFVGHVGGDDFIAVVRPAAAQEIAESIVAGFDRGIRTVQHDTRVPYCTLSIAIVPGSRSARGRTTYRSISERAARVKKEAKRRRGSVVVGEEELG